MLSQSHLVISVNSEVIFPANHSAALEHMRRQLFNLGRVSPSAGCGWTAGLCRNSDWLYLFWTARKLTYLNSIHIIWLQIWILIPMNVHIRYYQIVVNSSGSFHSKLCPWTFFLMQLLFFIVSGWVCVCARSRVSVWRGRDSGGGLIVFPFCLTELCLQVSWMEDRRAPLIIKCRRDMSERWPQS